MTDGSIVADRLTPAAVIPMTTPDEAIAERKALTRRGARSYFAIPIRQGERTDQVPAVAVGVLMRDSHMGSTSRSEECG